MSKINETLEELKTQVLLLLEDLLNTCPDADIIAARFYFEHGLTSKKIMDGFIQYVYPWKDKIKRHDRTFFEQNDYIFGPLPIDKVAKFKVMLKDGTFDQSDIDTIWAYFDVFISLMDMYKKLS